MNDVTKFKRITKPLKFRKIRLLLKSVGLTYEVGKERIKYLIYYILYRLNILKRYNYRTNYEKFFEDIPNDLKYIEVDSEDFKVLLETKLVKLTNIHLDYFYRNQNGGRKIVYSLVDNQEESRLFAKAIVKDIYLKIDGEFIQVNTNSLNHTIVQRNEKVFPWCKDEATKELWSPPKLRTFNLIPIKYLCDTILIGKDLEFDQVSEPMLVYYSELFAMHFREKLNSMSLEDIEVIQDDGQETP